MTHDRRYLRANERVALAGLAETAGRNEVEASAYCVMRPMVDMCRAPGGGRDKQLVFGARFEVLEIHAGWAFGWDPVDGYVGYIEAEALGVPLVATHRTVPRLAHLYEAADFKSRDVGWLPARAQVAIVEDVDGFGRLSTGGWLSLRHVEPISTVAADWVTVAEGYLGVSYLWGGNTALGIDCSGLVQAAMALRGLACPRDSDVQEAAFPEVPGEDLARGDLVFWRGHVGLMRDAQTLLHANAHHMAVAEEPLSEAIARIGQREFGAVTKYARPVVG